MGPRFPRRGLDNGWRSAYTVGMLTGRTQLREWISRRCDSDREAARILDLDHTFLSQLLNGHRSPGLANAVKIERVTGISVEAWLPTGVGEAIDRVADGVRKQKTG